jgi:tRNA-(ms[2]io[6]A)-hydroxylase
MPSLAVGRTRRLVGAMLNLTSSTREDWAGEALANLDLILLDHAHCEKKAASTALNLIFRHQDKAFLMRPLSELAREELEHFELVLTVLEQRGIAFQPLLPSPYAAGLREAVRKGDPDKLVDVMLICSLIEARSCERMKILSEVLPEPELATFYRDLLASEARHHTTYVDLACHLAPESVVRERLRELAAHEAQVLSRPVAEVRLHT